MSDPATGDVFKPGDECLRSGVYRVLHDPNHADEHEVTCVFGQIHETHCQSCGTPVKFEINHEIEPLMKRNHA
jgi:hypothetical protein